ncbi:hypothetical protein EVJ58_g5769 [Rhodofomes roseus]|uniref:Uncharacterized protein n=1 Tax=Rhodofomes roseus TaxID=34475 RepID=A0A4Y9YC34_9APHY|nr:hypothetical protein EVJ58_g5769 [Rhodofomes roseus]
MSLIKILTESSVSSAMLGQQPVLTRIDQGQDSGTSVSESVNGDNANTAPVAASYGTGTYPGYGGTRTTPQVPRGLSTLTPQDAQKSLYELVNGTTRGVSTRNLQREDSSDGTLLDDADPDLNGAPGESIYGDAIPGSGPNGGHAYPGKPGPSDGGRVIESGNVEDNGSNTPGAGGLSRSGTASGGNGRT